MNLRPFVLIPMIAALTGCDAIRSMLPSANFDRMELQSITWSGVDADFVFAVNNPSPVEIEIVRFNYALEFDGNEWATGESANALKLSAIDQSEMILPLSIHFAELYELVDPEEERDTLPYGISGSIGFDTPAGIVDLPFSHEGDFPALRTPILRPTGLRVDSMDVLGGAVGLTIEMVAQNRHQSAFQIDDFRYRISMMDTDVVAGFVEDLGSVDGGDTAQFELPMELRLIELGTAVYTAVVSGGGEVDVGLDVSANVVTPFGTIPFSGFETRDVAVQ
jgi:hypothetical protein